MYTIKEYNKKIDEKYKVDKFRVIESDEFIKDKDTIVVECLGCQTTKNVNARTFIRQVAKTDKFAAKLECPVCRAKRKEQCRIRPINTLESIKEELKEKFDVLSYDNNTNIKVICKKCNNNFTSSLAVLRKSSGCINCNGHKEYTIESLQKISDTKFGNGILIKSIWQKEYSNCKKRFVTVIFNNKEYSKSVSEFLRYGINREAERNINSLKNKIKEISNGRYSIKENEYKGRKAKYTFYNIKTGFSRKISFDNFMKNPVLENSLFSKYAIRIFNYLNKKHVYFKTEKYFNGTGKKRFDIYLPNSDSIIEIDGEQHFFNIYQGLIKTNTSDNIKNTFCQKNNKTLLRISYTEILNDNYKDILDLFLNHQFEELIRYNILLIHNKKIFNENIYYAPVKSFLIKRLTENFFNCWKTLRAEMIGQSAAKPL